MSDPPSLDKIARVADVSVSTLTRSFRRKYGVTPMAFMKQRRLEMVRGQLLTARDDGTTVIGLTLETQGVNQLSRLLSKFEMVRGVLSAIRQVSSSVSQNS